MLQAGWERAWGKSWQEMHEAAPSGGSATCLVEMQRHLILQRSLHGCERSAANSENQKLVTWLHDVQDVKKLI